ncbi:MAG: imidazoleglycerol-phosphate dehydratase HisB [Sedimentisphaeraceae bacterium JB056]
MEHRTAQLERKTTETQIKVELNLDGKGSYDVATGVGFLDHMLAHLSKHSGIDLNIQACGDTHIDDHHTVEDVGICIGQCFEKALGDKRGIVRYGNSSVPMEDALANVAVDISGRPFCVYNADYPSDKIGAFDVELIEEFLRAFTNSCRINLHVNVPYGTNSHHIAEGVFKALGRSIGQAVKVKGDQIPSTKGVL